MNGQNRNGWMDEHSVHDSSSTFFISKTHVQAHESAPHENTIRTSVELLFIVE